jgi:hypothetical protein
MREGKTVTSNRLARAFALASSIALLASCGTQATQQPADAGKAEFVVSIPTTFIAFADIDRVDVTIHSTAGTYADIVKTLNYNAGANTWSGLIGGIPPGPATVSATAYDLTNHPLISSNAAAVTITSGGVATANLFLQGGAGNPFQNDAPVFESVVIIPGEASPGGTVSITGHATDLDNDPLTFSASATAGSVSISGAGGAFTATFTAPASEGIVTITLVVSDGRGGTSRVFFPVRVRKAPGAVKVNVSFSAAPEITEMSGNPLPLEIGIASTFTVSASDPQGEALSYAWASDCPGTWLNQTSASDARFTLGQTDLTTCAMSVTVTSASGSTNNGTFVVPVGMAAVNHQPVITSWFQTALLASAGEVIDFTVLGYDPDNDGLIAAWSATGGTLGTGLVTESTTTVPSIWTFTNTWEPPVGCTPGTSFTVRLEIDDDFVGQPVPPVVMVFNVGCN